MGPVLLHGLLVGVRYPNIIRTMISPPVYVVNNLTKVTHQLIQLTLTFLIFIKTHSKKNKATTNMQINVNFHAEDNDKWTEKLIHDQYKKVQKLYSACQGNPQNRTYGNSFIPYRFQKSNFACMHTTFLSPTEYSINRTLE